MTLKPGSSENDNAFADSMAEDIENALKMEWLAIKGEPFPEIGKSARRIFLSAIAQGVINHLMSTLPYSQILIQSPHIELNTFGVNVNQVNVKGSFFPLGAKVTVTWDDDPDHPQSTSVENGQTFNLFLNIPDGSKPGRHVIEARDGHGNVALAVFVIA